MSVFNGSVQIFPEIFHFIVTIFSFFVFCAFVSGLCLRRSAASFLLVNGYLLPLFFSFVSILSKAYF